jgi:glutaredoxin 3
MPAAIDVQCRNVRGELLLDQMKDGNAIQSELLVMTGQGTVPNVFVNGQHVGGNAETQAAFLNGRLAQMIKGSKL